VNIESDITVKWGQRPDMLTTNNYNTIIMLTILETN